MIPNLEWLIFPSSILIPPISINLRFNDKDPDFKDIINITNSMRNL